MQAHPQAHPQAFAVDTVWQPPPSFCATRGVRVRRGKVPVACHVVEARGPLEIMVQLRESDGLPLSFSFVASDGSLAVFEPTIHHCTTQNILAKMNKVVVLPAPFEHLFVCGPVVVVAVHGNAPGTMVDAWSSTAVQGWLRDGLRLRTLVSMTADLLGRTTGYDAVEGHVDMLDDADSLSPSQADCMDSEDDAGDHSDSYVSSEDGGSVASMGDVNSDAGGDPTSGDEVAAVAAADDNDDDNNNDDDDDDDEGGNQSGAVSDRRRQSVRAPAASRASGSNKRQRQRQRQRRRRPRAQSFTASNAAGEVELPL